MNPFSPLFIVTYLFFAFLIAAIAYMPVLICYSMARFMYANSNQTYREFHVWWFTLQFLEDL